MIDPGEATAARVLGVAGVVGLLLVGVACVMMVAGVGRGGGNDVPVAAASATATPTPTPTPKPSPTPVPLTPEQRVVRKTAVELVRSRGFEPARLRDYNPRRTLRVLLGKRTDGARLAFFFVGDRYIGNDAGEASGKVRVRRQANRRITLAYGTYAPGDKGCCPTGGPVNVRFDWDGAALRPLDPLPPAQQRSPAYQQG